MKALHHALILYGIFVTLLYAIKPDCFFDEKGDFKSYGLGANASLLPCSAVCVIAAVGIYTYTVILSDKNVI